jgi:raffinose/stachyose/melibiose transport system substrate-binding protein
MKNTRTRRIIFATAGIAALALAACGNGGGGGGGGETTGGGGGGGDVSISFLTPNGATDVAIGEALSKAFTEKTGIQVNHETQPGGTEGDNLNKTKLATGEMANVFYYNSGSLLMALNPDQNLVNLSDQAWAEKLDPSMTTVVSTDNGLYGTPLGASQAGAVLYNKKVYAELGLQVPTSWAEFVANNEKIKAAGKTAVIQTYGDTWTSQLFVLGDFGNVIAQDADWADEYTAGNRKYAEQPGLQGFQNQEDAGKAGWFNENYASAVLDDGLRLLATGDGVHFPMLTGVVATIQQNFPDNLEDIGVFPLPAQDAANTNLTVWLPNGVYIPKTTEGDKLDAAKQFLEFINSEEGCKLQNEVLTPSGPFATTACALPADVPGFLKDMQVYFDAGQTKPALEFLSPIKGPNLENITVEVGSGIRSAADGAALYDEDVKKQAQQLGLEGW